MIESPPANFRPPCSLNKDHRDSDEESGDDSITKSEDEDSEIEFSEDSDDDFD
jgi:hypothetical protein